METGDVFANGPISPRCWEQDAERKRRPSNDRVPENMTERSTVSSMYWQQEPQSLPSQRLISMGRKVYDAALANPDSLVDVVETPGFEVAASGEFGSVADPPRH